MISLIHPGQVGDAEGIGERLPGDPSRLRSLQYAGNRPLISRCLEQVLKLGIGPQRFDRFFDVLGAAFMHD
jgi:hypothetical protein